MIWNVKVKLKDRAQLTDYHSDKLETSPERLALPLDMGRREQSS